MAGGILKKDNVIGTVVLIEAGDHHIKGLQVHNTAGAACFVSLFNTTTATGVTLGTTTPDWEFTCGATTVAGDASIPTEGLRFDKGIAAASTTGVLNTTNATANIRIVIL